ncbi:MAG: hypothetical protein H0X51_05225 [Parachlamydiaceae bacterium]|nr:hypothetical protein [Parachlamydiaceae bacterium]
MDKVKQYKINFKSTYPYFIAHINCGNFLSKEILQHLDFSKGNFYTILPTNASIQKITLFEEGGIIPQSKPLEQKEFYGKKCLYQEKSTTKKELEGFITYYLHANSLNLAMLEDVVREPTSPNVNIEDVRLITRDMEVFYLINHQTPASSLGLALARSKHVWHTLYVLAGGLNTPDVFKEEDFMLISKAATHVIISAYDGESYIIWEKAGQSLEYPGFELTDVPKDSVSTEESE